MLITFSVVHVKIFRARTLIPNQQASTNGGGTNAMALSRCRDEHNISSRHTHRQRPSSSMLDDRIYQCTVYIRRSGRVDEEQTSMLAPATTHPVHCLSSAAAQLPCFILDRQNAHRRRCDGYDAGMRASAGCQCDKKYKRA